MRSGAKGVRMIEGLFDSGALPVLERTLQFTEARHRVLAHDVANASTPYFKPLDLSPASFQQALRQAIDNRRRGSDATAGKLDMPDTDQLRFTPHGLVADPTRSNEGILFHDQNNRDMERLMQHVAENTLAFRVNIEFLRGEMNTLQTAIRERI